ncbi:MAG: hypothetical protein HYV90_02600 [Candidatus Woesebacteria bacterium]|nr:MAG: hypothetical protein HYV90_02600 [Candidatus Woesebacteria bacterium]
MELSEFFSVLAIVCLVIAIFHWIFAVSGGLYAPMTPRQNTWAIRGLVLFAIAVLAYFGYIFQIT